MLAEARCFELLDVALSACDCDQAEVVLDVTNSALTRFAESAIHQNVAETDATVSVRAVLGKRIGHARGNQLGLDAVRSVAQRAVDLARVSAEDQHFVSLPQPQPVPKLDSYSGATAASTPAARAESVRTIVRIADDRKCRASGALSVSSGEVAIANSLGVRAYAPVSQSSLVTVVADDDSSGYAEWRGIDLSQLNVESVAEAAADKCVRGRGAEAVEPGEYTVILEPAAVGDMLFMLGYMGLGALAVQEGRSFLTGHLGEKIVGENITIFDDATDLRHLAFPFDWEGLPSRKTVIIENGLALTPVYDTYTAAKEGKASTGNALPAPNTYGPLPTHLFLESGDATVDDMIAATDRGILVTRFHYTNIIHEKQTIFTGMTRDGTFLIEGGKIVKPVKNLRFTQSIIEALSNVEMIGRGGQASEYTFTPAVKIEKFAFTS